MSAHGCDDIDYSSCSGSPAPVDGSDTDISASTSASTGSINSDADEDSSSGSSTCPYDWYSGDILGLDLRHEPASSADECCSFCNEDSSCYGW